MSRDNPDERRRRAEARRARVTLRRTTHDAPEPGEVWGEAALSLAAYLARAAWSLSGRAFPVYERAETPYVFVPNRAPRA